MTSHTNGETEIIFSQCLQHCLRFHRLPGCRQLTPIRPRSAGTHRPRRHHRRRDRSDRPKRSRSTPVPGSVSRSPNSRTDRWGRPTAGEDRYHCRPNRLQNRTNRTSPRRRPTPTTRRARVLRFPAGRSRRRIPISQYRSPGPHFRGRDSDVPGSHPPLRTHELGRVLVAPRRSPSCSQCYYWCTGRTPVSVRTTRGGRRQGR